VDVADSTGRRVKPRSSKQPPASEVVREAIRDSGLPIRELARRTGVEPSVLSRFMSEQVGISLSTFEKLADELGLRVVTGKRAAASSLPPESLAGGVLPGRKRQTASEKKRRDT
jgi:transcriptional regulator with XRE-family HTH domain